MAILTGCEIIFLKGEVVQINISLLSKWAKATNRSSPKVTQRASEEMTKKIQLYLLLNQNTFYMPTDQRHNQT